MKHNSILSIALLGSFMLLAASCVEEVTSNEEQYRPADTPIVFSASSGYENAPETRAEYSGATFAGTPLNGSTPVYERIDWKVNDKIQIVHNGSASSYTVASVSNSTPEADRNSYAELTGGNLTWGENTAAHTFYALYPSGNGAAGTLSTSGQVSGTIPATQNVTSLTNVNGVNKYQPNTAQYGYMAAYANVPGTSQVWEVKLPFRPAFTCFEFKFQRSDTQNPAISSFELKTVPTVEGGTATPLTGGFSFQISGGDQYGATWTTPAASSITTPGYSITVGGFGANGVTVPTSGYLDFSVLALPIDLTGVELVVHYANGATKTLKFKNNGAWHQFTGAKKYVITNTAVPGSDWEYNIEEIDDITTYGHLAASLGVEVKSYRTNKLNGTIQAVSWKAQYWDGTTWQDWTAQQGDFSLSNSYTGNGVSNPSSNHEDRTVGLTRNTNLETVTNTSIEILQAASPVTDYDLSLHDVFGNGHTQTTANTYVISAPGTYRFPCVYGNAITNGSTNYESFAPGRSPSSIVSLYTNYVADTWDTAMGGRIPIRRYPDVNYNRYFRNALNLEITRPYIIEDIDSRSAYNVTGANVAIVWQDEQIMSDSDFSLITVDGHKYIQFSLSAANIKPGNIVVALRGAPGGDFTDTKTILWSWQLWITERDLTPIDGIMPSNLGWNKVYNGSRKYTDRTLPIRLIQIAPSDDPSGAIDNEEFTVTQLGDSEHIGENVGTNPYYQWGRKDPMIPGIYGGSNVVGEPCSDKTIYPGSDYSGMNSYATLITTNSTPATPDYGTAIRNPHVVYIAGLHPQYGTTSWISGYVPTWATITGDGGRSGGSFQGERVYTAIPYNLWNSYCIGYDNPGTDWSSSTKFKTVYDPCPPGFTVPHRGLEDILGSGTDAPDHSGKYFSLTGGATQFLPYTGARIFYNTSGVIPGTSVTVSTAGIYLRHVAGSSNEYGLYWTDCPTQFRCTTPNLAQPTCFDLSYYTGHFYSQMYLFTSGAGDEDTMDYTKGTAGAIRPMVDPRYAASTPSSPSSAAPNGSINPLGNYNNIPAE